MNRDTIIGLVDLNEEYEEIVREVLMGSGQFKDLGTCEVHIYGGEGNIPHAHIVKKSDNFDTCICLYQPKYFTHGKHISTFSSRQLKALNKWMETKDKDGVTMWKKCINEWNNSNPNSTYPQKGKKPKRPDFSKIDGSVHE